MKKINLWIIALVLLLIAIIVFKFAFSTYSNSGITSTNAISQSTLCLDNTKKIAVYLSSTNKVAHDPLFTSMFFEYNLDYLTDSTISTKLTPNSYDLLLVPTEEMSEATASAINTYLNNGGHVWFFADPRLKENDSQSILNNNKLQGTATPQLLDTLSTPSGEDRITILNGGSPTEYNIGKGWPLTVDNTDPITSGMLNSYYPVGSEDKATYTRYFPSYSGTTSGFNYKVLISLFADSSLLIKFENPTTGARAIYSNPNMFISGGTTNYFDRPTATKMFQNTKAWILGLDTNKCGISVTYPKGDKQVTVSIDDIAANDSEISQVQPFFDMEASHDSNVQNMNTFFIIPSSTQTTKTGLAYYTQYGDTHTLHPHDITDWTAAYTTSQFQVNVTKAEGIINKAAGVSDYGFISIRFPGTTGAIPAYQAMANEGLTISSNYGPMTGMGKIGDPLSNNIFFPKQKILYNQKTNILELEVPTYYDINSGSGTAFYNASVAQLSYFKGINFPANYVIGGHIQGIMINSDLRSGTSQVMSYITQNSGYTSYSTFDQIAKYTANTKNANIKATNTPTGVNVDITTLRQIDSFTIKLTNVTSNVRAQYDGSDIDAGSIVQTGDTCYIIHTVDPGTHHFDISESTL